VTSRDTRSRGERRETEGTEEATLRLRPVAAQGCALRQRHSTRRIATLVAMLVA
jgi:hypothetical protein